jgi:hypothetical protein
VVNQLGGIAPAFEKSVVARIRCARLWHPFLILQRRSFWILERFSIAVKVARS